jgi:Uma2 family endonuclease
MSSSILSTDEAGAELPDHKQLPESDGSAMPNMQQPPQTDILDQCLIPVLDQIHPDGQYCVAGDCFIYFKYTEPVLAGCKAPDWFYVPGVSPVLDGEIRRSYVLWKEHVPPLIVMEYVSGDGSEEHDTTPDTGKFWVYEQAIVAPFYVIFDPQRASLEVYRLVEGRYQQMTPNEHARYLIEPMKVELGVWEGTVGKFPGTWLRAWDPATGKMLELLEERLETAEERAETAEERAETAEERAETAESSLVETRELLTEQGNKTEAERKRADEQSKRADEQSKRADEQNKRADEQNKRADGESKRADEQSRRADEQSRRAALLAAKLRELGINPDDLTAS